jgi:hypothetical protein
MDLFPAAQGVLLGSKGNRMALSVIAGGRFCGAIPMTHGAAERFAVLTSTLLHPELHRPVDGTR